MKTITSLPPRGFSVEESFQKTRDIDDMASVKEHFSSIFNHQVVRFVQKLTALDSATDYHVDGSSACFRSVQQCLA